MVQIYLVLATTRILRLVGTALVTCVGAVSCLVCIYRSTIVGILRAVFLTCIYRSTLVDLARRILSCMYLSLNGCGDLARRILTCTLVGVGDM